ncbi:hypothetical protein GIW26_20420 [Pseudomonas syringae]|nr:hypothetical protein [Pseudomonas syringae]
MSRVTLRLFAKTVFQSMCFRRLCSPLREQVRSHGLRPESKADLCITMSADDEEREVPRSNITTHVKAPLIESQVTDPEPDRAQAARLPPHPATARSAHAPSH